MQLGCIRGPLVCSMNETPNNPQPVASPVSAAAAVACPRCQGTGRLLRYDHIQGGICFRCRGNGQQLALSQAATPVPRITPVAPTPLGITLPAGQLADLRASSRSFEDCKDLPTVLLPFEKLCKGRLTASQWLFLLYLYLGEAVAPMFSAYMKHVGLWTRAELKDLHDRGYFLRTSPDGPLSRNNAAVTERFTDLYHGVEIDVLYA